MVKVRIALTPKQQAALSGAELNDDEEKQEKTENGQEDANMKESGEENKKKDVKNVENESSLSVKGQKGKDIDREENSEDEHEKHDDENDDEHEKHDENDEDYDIEGENDDDTEFDNAVNNGEKISPKKKGQHGKKANRNHKRTHKNAQTSPTRPKRKVVHYPKEFDKKGDFETKSPRTPKKKHANTGQMSFRDASLQMLQEAGEPLSAQELAKRIVDQGLVVTTGKTPDRTIAAMIYNEIRHKPGSPFKLQSPGVFGLKEYGDSGAPATASTPKRTTRSSTTTAQDDSDAELEDDANDEDYESPASGKKGKRGTKRITRGTPKKAATPTKRKTPTKKAATPKKKRKVSHNNDAKHDDEDEISAKNEEDEEDIDNDLLSVMNKKDTKEEEKQQPAKKEASRPMGKKQKILDKVKHDNETPKVEETKEDKFIPPTRTHGFKQNSVAYGYNYLQYFLDQSKRKSEGNESSDNECFVCKQGTQSGMLTPCDYPKCNKVYHPSCLDLGAVPKGKWLCPHHYCIECLKEDKRLESPNATIQCSTCPTAYCDDHKPKTGFKESTIDKSQIICQDCLPEFLKIEQEDPEDDMMDENEKQDKTDEKDEQEKKSEQEERKKDQA